MEAMLTRAWRCLTVFTEQVAAGEVSGALEVSSWESGCPSCSNYTPDSLLWPTRLHKTPHGQSCSLSLVPEVCRGGVQFLAEEPCSSPQGRILTGDGCWSRALPRTPCTPAQGAGRHHCSVSDGEQIFSWCPIPELPRFCPSALWEEGERFPLGKKGQNGFDTME